MSEFLRQTTIVKCISNAGNLSNAYVIPYYWYETLLVYAAYNMLNFWPETETSILFWLLFFLSRLSATPDTQEVFEELNDVSRIQQRRQKWTIENCNKIYLHIVLVLVASKAIANYVDHIYVQFLIFIFLEREHDRW